MKASLQLFALSVLVAISGLSTGCTVIDKIQNYRQAQHDQIELKKSQYMLLKRDIATNELRNGALAQDIKGKYGPPDDIFYSNSSGNSFQMWTYNISKDKLSDTRFDPILLYLDNDKLISWKY